MKPMLGVVLLAAATQAQSITWTTTWEQAVARAKAENKPIFVAINMEGERANDEMAKVHYHDPAIVKLSEKTVNLFCSQSDHGATCTRATGITCRDHRQLEIEVRQRVLKIKDGDPVSAPQHLFLAPDGSVLSSVVFRISPGELEWLFGDAIQRIDPKFQWVPAPRAHAPRTAGFTAKPPKNQTEAPPTKEEVTEALREIKKTRGGGKHNPKLLQIVARSPEPEARQFAETVLRGVGDERKAEVLKTIGRSSPKEWSEVVIPYVTHRQDDVRIAAATALEQLGDPKAVPTLKAQIGKETDPEAASHEMRAMAALAPADRQVAQQIQKAAQAGKDEAQRAGALVAAAPLEDRELVLDCARTGLQDKSPRVRAAAAYLLAARQERSEIARIERAHEIEEDPETRMLLQAALDALQKRSGLEAFKRLQ